MKTKMTWNPVMLLAALSLMAICSTLQAQTVYKISETSGNLMKLSGTSTLHKWDMTAKSFVSEAQFGFASGNSNSVGINSLTALSFTLGVKNLKSGESGLDENAYKALKADTYKNITYKLTSAQVLNEAGKNLIRTHGNLIIAGFTKNVAIDVFYVQNADGTITCKGNLKLKMTDFKVEPPTFMFGAMKTGDDLVLDFTLVYKK